MKKRITSVLLVLALCLTLLPTAALAAANDSMKHTPHEGTALTMSGKTLMRDNSEWTPNTISTQKVDSYTGYLFDGGTYYLDGDLTLAYPIAIKGEVKLCLNGHTITYEGNNESAISLENFGVNTHLILTDCSTNADHLGMISGGKGKVVMMQGPSQLDMYGGIITGCSNGNGVLVSSGCTFNMYGGKITGNGGWGVDISDGTFDMSGGTITGNTSYGVRVGRYYNDNSNVFKVSGGATVTGNGTEGTAKNVYLDNGQTIHVTGEFTGTIGVTAYDKSGTIVTPADASYIDTSKINKIFSSDDGAFGISTDDSGNIVLKEHNWEYTATDKNTITATCKDCHVSGGSVTITAPVEDTLTYNGKAKPAMVTETKWIAGKVTVTYEKDDNTITGEPTNAGDYTASIKLGEATASVDYTIKKAPLTVKANDTTIIYGEKLTGNGVKYEGLVSGDESKLGTLSYTYDYKQYGNVGENYTITPQGLYSNNYEITYVSGTLKVEPREVRLEWNNTEGRTVGDDKGVVTAKACNTVHGDAIFVTVKGGEQPTEAKDYTVTATKLTGEKAGNYKLPENATTTYTVGKAAATPQANTNLTYTGDAQELVSAGAAEGGKLVYSDTKDGSYSNDIPKGTNAGKYEVWYKVEGDKTHSSTTPSKLEVTIASKALTAEGVTVAKLADTTYTGSDIEPEVTVKDGETELTLDTDYTVSYKDNRNAGTATVTITGKGNYIGEATATWTITRKTPTPDDFNVTIPAGAELVYDGTAKQVTVTPKTSITGIGTATVIYECGDKKVAEAKNVGTYTVKIKLAEGKNFTADTLENKSWSFTISKGTYSGTAANTVNLVKNRDSAQSGTLTAVDFFVGSVPEGAKITVVNPASGTMLDSVAVKDGKLTYTSKTKISDAANETYTVTIACTNYENIPATLTFHATDKITPTLDGELTLTPNKLTYGQVLSAIKLSGTMKDGDKTVSGTFEWQYPGFKPDTVGDCEAWWKFTPDDGNTYAEADGRVILTVKQAKPAGEPIYTKITAAGKQLKDANLQRPDSWPEGKLQWVDKDTGKPLPDDTPVTANTVYKWYFTPTGADAKNYTVAFGTVTLYSVSTGGSSGGGSSSGGGGSSSDRDSSDSNPIIKTETKNNADGSTTKTETRRDGSVTQTTTGKDGSVSKTETKKDGSSVTENKAADGSTGTVKTDKNGQTEAKTALSNKAIEDAKKSGEAVKAPVEVEASRNSNTAPTVKVELPKGAGETKVEIPVSNVKPGTVAVLVHPDGTEEIVKNSLPTEDGIQLTVNGNATVKIVDNSKDFIDTRNHWAKDAIDFVSARELVNGMSATIYAPNNSTTRAQLWTILARQNDANLNGGATWYEKAQLWSKDKGVSDGANPNGTINRAQMVTMLWRTMGQPAATDKVSFADVPAGSYYAQAVAWAVESGITAGVGGGRFDPTATCTRAQIAAFLTRLYAEK